MRNPLFSIYKVYKGYISNKCNPELQFSSSARRLMLVDIHMKFYEAIVNDCHTEPSTTRMQILLLSISKDHKTI